MDPLLASATSANARSHLLTRSIFLRLLGVVYLAAFASIACQIDGLVGSRGILPAARFLETVHETLGPHAYWRVPTLAWLNPSDNTLRLLWVNGLILSVALVIGLVPQVCLALLWVLYLSIVSIGQDFLSFQWDALLLEAGFLAILYAPASPSLDVRYATPPSPIVHFLLKWLLFRLMFLSGIVKITSGDPTWANWTAMTYHYETQPLPTWTSWYVHHFPLWAHLGASGGTFAVELFVPFLYFGPRRLRRFACALTILLQLSIAATGNYGYFNLLAIVLCVPLLDDGFWPAWLRKRLPPADRRSRRPAWREWLLLPVALVILVTSIAQGITRAHFRAPWLEPAAPLVKVVGELRITSAYGLFEVMTTQRPEIVIQGSDDGTTWQSYGFRWKPDDDLARRPRFCPPHMPRLDWQLWFAAMGDVNDSPWTIGLMRGILEGSPPVLGLLGDNPFPGKPPRYVRGLIYRYHFTTREERARTGDWWNREPDAIFCLPVSLDDLPSRSP